MHAQARLDHIRPAQHAWHVDAQSGASSTSVPRRRCLRRESGVPGLGIWRCCRRCVQQHHRGHRQNPRDQGSGLLGPGGQTRPLGACQVNRLAPAGINLYVKCASSEQRFRAQGAAHSSTVRRSLFPYGTKVVQEGGSSRVTQRCRCEYFNPLSSVKAEFDRGKVSKVPLQFSIARATLLKSASRAAHFISPPADFAGSACHCHHRGLTAKRNLLSAASSVRTLSRGES